MSPRRRGGAAAGDATPADPRRRARLGLRGELLILLPAALLLLVAVSTFTLFSYRGALLQLADERRAEAERQARGLANHLLAGGAAAATPTADWLIQQTAGVRGAALLDAAGTPLVATGELPAIPGPPPPPSPAALPPRSSPPPSPPAPPLPAAGAQAFTAGPDADLPDSVTAWVPLLAPAPSQRTAGAPGRLLYARVDLPAATLGAQLRAIRVLAWLVLPVNCALVLLVLLFLRHLLSPYETLLARARALGAPDDGPAEEDEAAFLIATLERALEALGERQGEPPPAAAGDAARRLDDDLAALERTLSPSLESGLLLLGRDGRVLSLNAVGAALLGAPEPHAGLDLRQLLAPHPEVADLLASAIADGRQVKRHECALHRDGGEPATVGLSVHPLRRDDGAVRGYLVLFADLTEARRRADERRLTERLATLGEMAAGVAHELRNSLATLRGYLTLIERRPDEESIADFLAEIRHESDHLQRVLEDFLAFARPGTARFQPVSLPALARRSAADPALAGVAIEVHAGAAGEGRLRGDPQLIERALRNLLANAVQAEREAGRAGPVEVRVGDRPGGVEVEVADRGPGVPAELRQRLFHPFATGRAGGVGLGLALTHRIVTLHGGRIRLDDREGGGTVARLFFPHDTSVTDGSESSVAELAAPL
jgi:signal transduction histidine kinase